MSDLPKMLSKREIELEELEEAKHVQSLRDDIDKLQGENNELRNEIARLSQQTQHSEPQLTIPQSIADELKEAIGATNFESTPYSIKVDEDGYLKMWASLRHKKLSEKTYKFCRDNTRVFDAYLNPLTRDLVKVVEG